MCSRALLRQRAANAAAAAAADVEAGKAGAQEGGARRDSRRSLDLAGMVRASRGSLDLSGVISARDLGSDAIATPAQGRGMVLPFTPLSLTFHGLSYYVDLPRARPPLPLLPVLVLVLGPPAAFFPGCQARLPTVNGLPACQVGRWLGSCSGSACAIRVCVNQHTQPAWWPADGLAPAVAAPWVGAARTVSRAALVHCDRARPTRAPRRWTGGGCCSCCPAAAARSAPASSPPSSAPPAQVGWWRGQAP